MHKKKLKERLPEIVFSSSNSLNSRQITNLVKVGLLRKLIPRVYTSNMIDADQDIIRKNLWMLIANLFPDTLIAYRSAIEFQLTAKDNLYLIGKSKKVYNWHGIKIRMTIGPARLSDDYPLYDQLYVSSLERALLENLMPSRTVDGERRTLNQQQIEERLLQELNAKGEAALNNIRDRARSIADTFGWGKTFEKLNQLIGSILSSQPKDMLQSPIALAKVLGEPYDAGRMDLFQKLVAELKNTSFESRPHKTNAPETFSLISFFESYFSNYIEGTTFEISEAVDIIFNNKIIPNRTGDTHDVLGTYRLVNDRFDMNQIPETPEEFLIFLQRRHQLILGGRKEKNPGIFKTIANRAGDSFFVKPEQVKGTLKHGFKLMSSLTQPMERALFVMFLVSEVHPFDDGNGRLARVMMNAELVHGKASKIIIPTVYRDDYILNLKKFTNQGLPNGYVKMMNRAHAFSHWLNPTSFDALYDQLTQSNAFRESSTTILQFPI
jgi:hypothetical protein